MAGENPALDPTERQSLVEIFADAMDLHVTRATERAATEQAAAAANKDKDKDAPKPLSLADRLLGVGRQRK